MRMDPGLIGETIQNPAHARREGRHRAAARRSAQFGRSVRVVRSSWLLRPGWRCSQDRDAVAEEAELKRRDVYSVDERVTAGCWTCTTRPGFPFSTVITARYRRSSLLSFAGSTIWRMGPTALTICAPAGLVMNRASGSMSPLPSALVVRARTCGLDGSSPTAAA